MIEQIAELLCKGMQVTFLYDCSYVACTVKRPYYKHLGVYRVGKSGAEALSLALALLDRVIQYEDDNDDIAGPSFRFTNDGGYHHLQIGDTRISLRREGMKWVISAIVRVDADDFYIVEVPYPLNTYKKCQKLEDRDDGTELWSYDNLGFLCGDAGLLIVKDGLVIKKKMTAMA